MAQFALSAMGFTSLLDILTEEQTLTQSFETICNKFHTCSKKESKLKVANGLLVLLENQDILSTQAQRLCALILLYDLYRRDQIVTTPFLPIFVHIINSGDDNTTTQSLTTDKRTLNPVVGSPVGSVCGTDSGIVVKRNIPPFLKQLPKFSLQERNFLSQIIKPGNNTKELLKTSAHRVITGDAEKYIKADISELEKAVDVRQAMFDDVLDCGISLIMPDPEPTPSEGITDDASVAGLGKILEELCKVGDPNSGFAPECIRLIPPLFVEDDELVWMDIVDSFGHKVAYDVNNSNLEVPEAVLKMEQLMSDAYKGALTVQQQQLFVSELDNDPSLVNNIGLTPKKFPELVEHNPLIAIEVLMKMMHSEHITDYFNVLVNMEMSIHSMEVVNRLTTKVDLPKEFIHLYISNCLTTCQTITDRYMQNRLVRLVCVFLQSLIRNNIINIPDIIAEVETFCTTFIRIREATALYKLLRSSQEENSELGEPSSGYLTSSAGGSTLSSSLNETNE